MNSTVKPSLTRKIRQLCTGAILALVVAGGLVPAPANAATLDNMIAFDGFHVGAFKSSGGALVYCLEPAVDTPFSDQLAPLRVSNLRGYSVSIDDQWGWSGQVTTSAASGEVLRQMNWVLSEHAPGASPERAVAVQIALWELRRESGNASWIDGKYALIANHGGQAHVTAGKQLAAQAKAEAVGEGHAAPEGGLSMQAGDAHGTGIVSYPVGTTSLSIAGGTFENGSSELTLTGAESGSAHWIADLHQPDWTRFHDVSVSGDWELKERYWPAEVILYPATVQSQQLLGAGVAPVTGVASGSFETVSVREDSRFAPALVTQVPEIIVSRDGGVFSDIVSVFADHGGAPWPIRAGEYLELKAEGTLYGPFTAPQPETAQAPQGAPVVLRSQLVLSKGPGDYEIRELERPLEAGYYYWVWEIVEESQTQAVRQTGLIAEGSHFADNFGVKAEGQLVPTELRWITQLRERELAVENLLVEDSVRVSLHGGSWLRTETGERIPANIRFTFYQMDEEPVRQTTPPTEAEELGHVFKEVTELDTWIDAPQFRLPEGTTGWVTVRACLHPEDQPDPVRGYISPWCDDFGVPEETAKILVPVEPETPEDQEEPELPDVPKIHIPEEPLAQTGGANSSALALAGSGVLGGGALLIGIASLLSRVRRTRENCEM